MDAKRGFVPDDERFFSEDALAILRDASRHVCFLLNEGYDLKQAVTFVGNHFLLSDRQRLAIMRSVATQEQLIERSRKLVPTDDLSNKEVWIDGFNTIITLEVITSHSIVFSCMDGAIRDLAALRGTYRLIPETDQAIRIMYNMLQEAGVSSVKILLDEPVSNSGRLKVRLAEIGELYPFLLDIQIMKEVDQELYQKDFVITSDSIILDHCKSWVNLVASYLAQTETDGLKVWQPAMKMKNII